MGNSKINNSMPRIYWIQILNPFPGFLVIQTKVVIVQKLEQNLVENCFRNFLNIKYCDKITLGLPWRTFKLQKSLQPYREDIQLFKIRNIVNIFLIFCEPFHLCLPRCESVLGISDILVRIRGTDFNDEKKKIPYFFQLARRHINFIRQNMIVC